MPLKRKQTGPSPPPQRHTDKGDGKASTTEGMAVGPEHKALVRLIADEVTKQVTATFRTESAVLLDQRSQGSNNNPPNNTNGTESTTNDVQINQVDPSTTISPRNTGTEIVSQVVEASVVNHIENIAGNSGFVCTAVPIQAKVND